MDRKESNKESQSVRKLVPVLDGIGQILHGLSVMYKMFYSSKLTLQIDSFTIELEHLRTFLIFTMNWRDADKHLLYDYALLPDIEAAISEIVSETINATALHRLRRIGNFINDSLLPLLSKIQAFRPRIKKAYDCILERYSFQSNRPMGSSDFWDRFYGSVHDNLHDVSKARNKLLVKEHLSALGENARSIGLFLKYVACNPPKRPNHQATNDLLTHLGPVIVRAARLSYLCWVDEMDNKASQGMIVLIHDMQKKLKPNTPEVIKMYLGVLKALKLQDIWLW